MGQYVSPYIGVGNNPVNVIDPDGGFWQELKNFVMGKGWNTNKALEFMKNNPGYNDLGWKGDRLPEASHLVLLPKMKMDARWQL